MFEETQVCGRLGWRHAPGGISTVLRAVLRAFFVGPGFTAGVGFRVPLDGQMCLIQGWVTDMTDVAGITSP